MEDEKNVEHVSDASEDATKKNEPVAREVAEKDIDRWLDFKKVGNPKRVSNKDLIEVLIDAICEGVIVVNDDCTITHNLKFPIGGDDKKTTTLVYRPRLTVRDTKEKTKGVKANDVDGRMHAYAAAVCQVNSYMIGQLDTEDHTITSAVTSFFF